MASEQTQVPAQQPGRLTTAEIVDRLSHFDGPPEEFLVNLLAVQCRMAEAQAGVVMRPGTDGQMELLAIHPQAVAGATPPVWLAQAVESSAEVLQAGSTAIKPLHTSDSLYGQPAKQQLIMLPIMAEGKVRGLAAYLFAGADTTALAHCRERLELSISLLSLYEMRLTLQKRKFDLGRLRMAMETLSAVNEHDKFAGAAMTMCNEVAPRWQCDRVSIGFLKGRYVHTEALSHTEKFSRKMKLVQDIESAMEECLDQDVEILYPSSNEATYIARSAKELSKQHGPMTVLSLPLRRAGEIVAVLTVERSIDLPFTLDEVEALRLTCDLCTARLANLYETGRWFGVQVAASARRALSQVVGPKHTWLKLGAMGICVCLTLMFLLKGTYKADASFVIEAQTERIVPAPFDGYIESVDVESGNIVVANQTVLARLETIDLESELMTKHAELRAAMTEADIAQSEGKIAEAQVAHAQADMAGSYIALLERRISEAEIKSPIDGTVIEAIPESNTRGSIQIGDAMFKVAPVESLRAELSVGEDRIADVIMAFDKADSEGKELRGELATEGDPGRYIGFVVERINPVAETEEDKNVFKVRVRLDETSRTAPGMSGIAKIHVGRRSYAYIWTRKLVNWVRMKLWI